MSASLQQSKSSVRTYLLNLVNYVRGANIEHDDAGEFLALWCGKENVAGLWQEQIENRCDGM